MTIQSYLRVLREQWLVILVGVTLGLSGVVAIFLASPREYTARLTMYVSSQGGDSTDAAYEGALLSQQRVASYVELVNTRRVAEEVGRRLQLRELPDDIADQISATSTVNSVLIDVWVVDHDPTRASRIANTAGAVFTGVVDELERPVDPNKPQAVAVRVVQPAVVPDTPSSTGLMLLLIQGLIFGLALGIALAFARNVVSRREASRGTSTTEPSGSGPVILDATPDESSVPPQSSTERETIR